MPSRSPRYYLPAEPFRLKMIEWLARQYREYNAWHERSAEGDPRSARPEWSRLSPVEYLELQIGCSRAWVDKFLAGRSTYIAFDQADRLLMAMNTHWRNDPGLREMYYEVDLAHLDAKKPCTLRRHGGGRRAKWNVQQAIQLYEQGLRPHSEIARRVGAPNEKAIRDALSSRGIVQPPERIYDRLEAIRLHDEEGLTWPEVAERLGVSTETVRAGASLVKRGLRAA